jgi:Iap family predicted aminopeptidase
MLTRLLLLLVLPLAALGSATPAPDFAASGRVAHAKLTQLCDRFGGRLTGSPADRAAMTWLADELRALGLEPRLDEFQMPGWERGADRVDLLVPYVRPLRVAALSYSDAHPAFEADVVDLGDFKAGALPTEKLRGRVGVLSPSTLLTMRQVAAVAKDAGLRAVLFINREGGGQLLARTGSFTGETLPLPIYSITQEEGRSLQRLLADGVPVRVRVETKSRVRPVTTANLFVRLPGKSPETVIVGGHFDSWDLGQGALDNGLGVAQLYALAHALRGQELPRTIELVWFNGEEQGLWGSRHAAARLGDAPVVAMVNLDMVGVPIAVNALGDESLVPALERWHATRPKPLPQGVQNINWFGSDHTPYQLAGVRAVTFNAPIPRESVRYYHDLADTIDKLPVQIVADSTAIIGDVVLALASDPQLRAERRDAAATEKLFTSFGLEPRMRGVGLWPFSSTPVR